MIKNVFIIWKLMILTVTKTMTYLLSS